MKRHVECLHVSAICPNAYTMHREMFSYLQKLTLSTDRSRPESWWAVLYVLRNSALGANSAIQSNLDFSRYVIINMGYCGWGERRGRSLYPSLLCLLVILTDVYTSSIPYPRNSGGWQHGREEGLSGLQVSFRLSMILITLDSPHI